MPDLTEFPWMADQDTLVIRAATFRSKEQYRCVNGACRDAVPIRPTSKVP